MWEYTEKVRDHFLHPRNVGEIENPDGVGEIGNITCGDALRLTFKLDEHGRIADIKFKTFGCGSAIASASMLTELAKGKTVEEVEKLSNKDIADALGGLPREKMHCSVMGQEALEAAVEYYRSGGKPKKATSHEGTVVCTCFHVTDKEIEKAIRENNLTTVHDVTNFTKAGGGCGGCIPDIEAILSRVSGEKTKPAPEPTGPLTTLQKIDRIRAVLNNDVKPLLARDGGDCELVDIDGNIVYLKFHGHCKGCAFSNITLTAVVERNLREKVSEELTVREVVEN